VRVPDSKLADGDPLETDARQADDQPRSVSRAGPWAMAASAARAETEARIRANRRGAVPTTGHQAPSADASPADSTLVTGFTRLDAAPQARLDATPDIALAWGKPDSDADVRPGARARTHRAAGAEHSADVGADSDTEQVASDRPDMASGAHSRRGRTTRGQKLSRTKRSGVVPGP
jgi:hypothetical protein